MREPFNGEIINQPGFVFTGCSLFTIIWQRQLKSLEPARREANRAGLDADSHMHVHAICWHAVLSMRPLGLEPLTPPPPGALIWGEGRCVLLLVRNNQSRPITFTARRALVAVTHWGLGRERCSAEKSDIFSSGMVKVDKHLRKKSKSVKMQMLHRTSFQLKLLWCGPLPLPPKR